MNTKGKDYVMLCYGFVLLCLCSLLLCWWCL